MSWADPTDLVSAVRDSIAACASWTGGAPTVHYPDADPNTDTLPLALIQEPRTSWRRPFEGAVAIPSGQVIVTLWLDASVVTIGDAEQLAEDISKELQELDTGLVIQGADFETSGEPDDGETAQANESGKVAAFSIDINITFGSEA